MLVQEVELGVLSVPLHKVYIQSELITGPVIVGVQPTLPVQGVSLLGNDLAGVGVRLSPNHRLSAILISYLLQLLPVMDNQKLFHLA